MQQIKPTKLSINFLTFSTTFYLLSLLSTSTHASWTNIKNQLNTLINANLQTNPQNRTISRIDVGLLDRYGCWCYFENDHSKGHGTPVNEIDRLCKILHDGYTCSIHDGKSENNDCTPWEINYNSATGLGFYSGINSPDIEAIRLECEENNPGVDKCPSRACQVHRDKR